MVVLPVDCDGVVSYDAILERLPRAYIERDWHLGDVVQTGRELSMCRAVNADRLDAFNGVELSINPQLR
jgi:hypothetical protein